MLAVLLLLSRRVRWWLQWRLHEILQLMVWLLLPERLLPLLLFLLAHGSPLQLHLRPFHGRVL